MSTQHSPGEGPQRRARRRGRRGQSLVEYALAIVLVLLVAVGPGRTIVQSFVSMATAVRSNFDSSDDATATPGPAPTLRLPPMPATSTAAPPTPTVITYCSVPNLVGQSYQAAVGAWESGAGFSGGTLTKPSGSSSTFQVGAQSIAPGSNVPCQTTTMQVTPKQCSVPNLQGQLYSAARAGAWSANGFVQGNLVPPSATSSDFTIARQGLSAGATVDCEATMVVEPNACIVPSMDGLMYDDVSGSGEAFANARFTSSLAAAWGNTSPRNRRIGGSSPPAGSVLACESTVTVSEKLCTVPDMAGLLFSQASATDGVWARAGFTGSLQKAWNGNQDRTIGSTSPGAGAQVACSSGVVTASESAATATPAAPTATPVPPTATPRPPTATPAPPTATPVPPTATPTPLALVVTLHDVTNGTTYDNDGAAPRVEARAHDPNIGTANGTGITRVVFAIRGPNNYSEDRTESSKAYCAFGGDSPCTQWDNWSKLKAGDYTITATAYSDSRPSASITITIKVKD